MNSCNTDISFSNYYHFQFVRFEYEAPWGGGGGGCAGLEWSGVETHNTDDLNILISKEFSKFKSAKTKIWNWQVFF